MSEFAPKSDSISETTSFAKTILLTAELLLLNDRVSPTSVRSKQDILSHASEYLQNWVDLLLKRCYPFSVVRIFSLIKALDFTDKCISLLSPSPNFDIFSLFWLQYTILSMSWSLQGFRVESGLSLSFMKLMPLPGMTVYMLSILLPKSWCQTCPFQSISIQTPSKSGTDTNIVVSFWCLFGTRFRTLEQDLEQE